MNRREALKSVALIMGGTVVGTQAFLTSCQSEQDERTENFEDAFSEEDVALMNEIAETIIPATDTPGAKAANVGKMMGLLVLDCYEEHNIKAFREGLEEVQKNFEDEYGHSFMEGSQEERHQFLSRLNDELEPMDEEVKRDQPEHYFRIMKELTLLAYFTSEIGATQALRYVETPGRYEGCIPYEKGQRAWAV